MTKHLRLAKSKKDDEFYTLLPDIERELRHYEPDLPGKHVHMPCDDYRVSNFWRYFYENFSRLGLSKITAMRYTRDGSCSSLVSYDGAILTVEPIAGDGSFESDEGRAAIAACDVVVTNPPFSIWGRFMETLLAARVRYIVIGGVINFIRRSVSGEVLSCRMSAGKSGRIGGFLRPDGSIAPIAGVFYTNIRPFSHSSPVKLNVKFDPLIHKRYDDYDAINCDKSTLIPLDFQGVIGVPVSFFSKLCPEQFEIIGLVCPHINGRTLFERILIRNKHPALDSASSPG